MIFEERPLSEIANIFELTPQILKNVKFQGKNPLEKKEIQGLIEKEKKILGDKGRILVRKSGTENLIRIMAEGEDEKEVNDIADRIKETLKN
jgi:phosphoglucosamine mutase